MTLHSVFQSYFLILGPVVGIHGSLTMILLVFSVLGTWCLFFLIIELKQYRSCPFSTNVSITKFNSSSRYFSEHDSFALVTNMLKIPLINAGLTNECSFIWTIVIAFIRCILYSYFSAPKFIVVTSKFHKRLVLWLAFFFHFVLYCFVLLILNIQKAISLMYCFESCVAVIKILCRGCHQLNIPKIVMGGLIDCTQKCFQN